MEEALDSHKQRIVRAFSAAAHYDQHAGVQRAVAVALAQRIAALPLPPEPRICEIGCGTGFLAEALARRIAGGDWLLTDLSPEMLQRARLRLPPERRFRFAVMDGEAPEALSEEAGFDLICSSLAAQWFCDLPAALTRLAQRLRPSGHLVITTLAEGTFREWRQAHLELGLEPGTPDYPSLAALRSIRPAGVTARVRLEPRVQAYPDARAFLSSLRAIGARVPARDRLPLTAGRLRHVWRAFEQAGSVVTYNVATCCFSRPRGG